MDLKELNDEQRRAVTHTDGPLLVLAGAGSGKTRVISHRVAHLIGRGVAPRHICALTFTNKAAREMHRRIGALVGDKESAAELTVSTFHSLGLSILRAERAVLGLPRNFAIYDQSDQIGCVREILRRVRGDGRRLDASAILARISRTKNAFSDAETLADSDDDYDQMTAVVFPKYQQALRAYGAVDFDDLVVETVRLLEADEKVGRKWRQRFRYLLVDEYQDTNPAQLRLAKSLVADHHNLCAVGDDDQSIYSWRGADPRGILNFPTTFPTATIVKLEHNYRSSTTILTAANAVIAHNKDRYGKTLRSNRHEGAPIVAAVAPDSDAEAQFVAREIDRMRSEDQLRLSDCAVLYRSNKQAATVEAELRQLQIPYSLVGGQQFFERKEVKDVIAYFRLALNPKDEMSLRRVINIPARGVGPTTVERLLAHARRCKLSLWSALMRAGDLEDLRPGARRSIEEFIEVVTALRRELSSEKVEEAGHRLISRVDWYDDLRAGAPNLSSAQRRIDNIEQLFESLRRFQERHRGREALAEYLHKLSLEGDADEDRDVDRGQKLLLTTLHGAKGLEFSVVFLVGMEESLLPHTRTIEPIVTDIADGEHASDVAEERRLAYVGMTRARDKLFLCRAASRWIRGRQSVRAPSRFLLEVPDELVEHRDLASEAAVPVAPTELSDFFQGLAGQQRSS